MFKPLSVEQKNQLGRALISNDIKEFFKLITNFYKKRNIEFGSDIEFFNKLVKILI